MKVSTTQAFLIAVVLNLSLVYAQDAAQVKPAWPTEPNTNNTFGYKFQPYASFDNARMYVDSFLAGAESNAYAPNISVCWNTGVNLAQYDIDLMYIKWMFGSTKDNILNFTLFMQNVSDVSYSCIDATENVFVWSTYKLELFGNNFNNVMLAGLQNLLGNVLTIQRLANQIEQFSLQNNTRGIAFQAGKIWKLLVDYEPVIVEQAGFNALGASADVDNDGIYLQGSDQNLTKMPKKMVRETPIVQEYEEFNVINIDWTFGIKNVLPGLGDLFAPAGGIELSKGFINGVNVPHDKSISECEKYVLEDFVKTLYLADNITASIPQQSTSNERTFAFFDMLLTLTKLSTFLHPIAFNCWNSYEHVGKYIVHQVTVVNGGDLKTYLMNVVYNFGHLFDSLRDFISFLVNDPRGDITNVYDAGFSLGQFVFFTITPNIAKYESQAKPVKQ